MLQVDPSVGNILSLFKDISIRTVNGEPALYKPLMLIYSLACIHKGHERLFFYDELDKGLNEVAIKASIYLKHKNFHYAFGRLESDGIWKVENRHDLKASSSGDLEKSELILKNIQGGFTEKIFKILSGNHKVLKEIYLYFIGMYFDESVDKFFLNLYTSSKLKGRKMALMSNEGEPVTRWWVSKALEVIKTERDIFTKSKMREARLKFMAGSNRLTTIKGWMVSAGLIENKRSIREYELTEFGFALYTNDPSLFKSSTWWAFHLSLCFSEDSEPYPILFLNLETITKDWCDWAQIIKKTQSSLTDLSGKSYKVSTIESLLSSVRRMFQGDNPLAELGLVEINSGAHNSGATIRLGSPILSDEIFMHALALARFSHFKSRDSISFSELAATGLPNFLCCSKEDLRKNLQRMSSMSEWQRYFGFDYAVDLESITFKDLCVPNGTLLNLLQKGQDTWL